MKIRKIRGHHTYFVSFLGLFAFMLPKGTIRENLGFFGKSLVPHWSPNPLVLVDRDSSQLCISDRSGSTLTIWLPHALERVTALLQ